MNDKDKMIISSYANKLVDRGLSTPAIFFLEMFKYLSFIFSQSMIIAGPLATVFIDRQKYYKISDILAERDNVEYFICQIENNQEK